MSLNMIVGINGMSGHFRYVARYIAAYILFRPTIRWTVKYVHINGKVCTHKVSSNVPLDEKDIRLAETFMSASAPEEDDILYIMYRQRAIF